MIHSNLKVTVYWGDILYDTQLCQPGHSFTVGPKAGNSFILQLDGASSMQQLPLVSVDDKDTAEIAFDERVEGHFRFGRERLPIGSVKKNKGLVPGPDGLYRLKITRNDGAALVIGHVSFYMDWAGGKTVVARGAIANKRQLFAFFSAGLSTVLLFFLVHLSEVTPPPKPADRVVTLISRPQFRPKIPAETLAPQPKVAKAAAGKPKSREGGAAKGPSGKAALTKRTSAAEQLRSSNLGNLVKNLSNLGSGGPAIAQGGLNDGNAAISQLGAGGLSTNGLKVGGGGKTVGLGRTVGQGEGGFQGAGQLGLSGGSLMEGSNGRGGGSTVTKGGLDRDVIDSIVRRRQDRIRLCYERQLNFNPRLSGKISVKFTIGKDGSVVRSSISEDTMQNASIRSCILGEVKTWTFPAPVGGTLVTVEYPFLFESSARGGP